jgi:hypothetical protein
MSLRLGVRVFVGLFGDMETRLHSASAIFLMHKQYSIRDVKSRPSSPFWYVQQDSIPFLPQQLVQTAMLYEEK